MESVLNNPAFEHILEKIFLALDSKSLQNCELVSKSLAASLKDPRLWFKKCLKKNLIADKLSFEAWNRLFKATGENEAKRSATKRILKILFMDQNEQLKNSFLEPILKCHPIKLSILCQEFELAEFIHEIWNAPEERKIKNMFEILKRCRSGKLILAFVRKYNVPAIDDEIVDILNDSRLHW